MGFGPSNQNSIFNINQKVLIHRSPAFTAIYNEIRNSKRNCILDLGGANKGAFDLFSELSCKIYFEDLQANIQAFIESGGDLDTFDVLNVLSHYKEDEKFDVIFAWDIFNYLNLATIKIFFEKIKKHCKPNTIIYVLRYLEDNIAPSPRVFTVSNKYLFEVSNEPLSHRKIPAYSTMQLLTAMPNCFMQDTSVNQMGMLAGVAEHVVRFSPSFDVKYLINRSESSAIVPKDQRNEKKKNVFYYSPSMSEIVKYMEENPNLSVLDLGSPANRGNDKLVELAGSYYRVDLYSTIELSKLKKTDKENLSLISKNLNKEFDLIFTWDLFSFCTPTKIKQLSKLLTGLSHKKTRVSSYIYICRQAPQKPAWFFVRDKGVLSMGVSEERSRISKNLTGITLLRLFEPFGIKETFAFREGMNPEVIEYCLELNTEAKHSDNDIKRFLL